MAENIINIKAQVRSLEDELKVLKTSVEHAQKSKKKLKTFTSLRGIWKGKVRFTMKEIKDAEINIKGF